MAKAIMLIFVLLLAAACSGNAPPPARSNLKSFKILSEQADPAAGTLSVKIQVIEPVSQAAVSSAAESVIDSFKQRYPSITVTSYAGGEAPGAQPYAVSKLEGGQVTHEFGPEAATRKIPTH
jgi:ABC-type glycerol-3-phosphate transport system substrate-binding protein